MNHTHSLNYYEIVWVLVVLGSIYIYCRAAILSNRQHNKKWPFYRYICWTGGVLSVASVLVGPIAAMAHENFLFHMVGHLLLGMAGPLLIALSAPMTLFFRVVDVKTSRLVTRFLRSTFISFISDPIVASILNIGGLWLLYSTNLFALMHYHFGVYLLIHLHIYLAGYFFTISMIYIDPVFHRKSFFYRTIVMLFAFAGHSILAKYIYAYPPQGVPNLEAEQGGKLMYYGGDIIEIILITPLCWQWYKATHPKPHQKNPLTL